MQYHPVLRPRVYADEINKLIRRIVDEYEPIDVHQESRRIFGRSGVSMDITLDDLTRMGVLAQAARKGGPRG
ncbi:hypothetical protein [Labrys wisconsinensis]|uniref:Uncharacterized protein n=1 Tax=Labrys wisconsinensis TaxID=425677 RepID=A0ABU0J8H9_9HYPH|nr:hypothetical protein [Labrys wisconsinensis]MDQ0470585.1 hypothetical protein [Labrys wisconsinensis]